MLLRYFHCCCCHCHAGVATAAVAMPLFDDIDTPCRYCLPRLPVLLLLSALLRHMLDASMLLFFISLDIDYAID